MAVVVRRERIRRLPRRGQGEQWDKIDRQGQPAAREARLHLASFSTPNRQMRGADSGSQSKSVRSWTMAPIAMRASPVSTSASTTRPLRR
jgi:hypothetical protein